MADTTSRTGSRYATPELVDFVNRVHAAHDEALQLAFDAPGRHDMPAIQVAPSEGKLLGMLAALCGARRAVEVGTLAGYSAIHLARAMPEDGVLHCLELEPRHAEVARASLQAAGVLERTRVHVGPALESLESLASEAPFDLVFLDADKEGYPRYGRWALEHLRPGGMLLADNVYFFGQLMADTPAAAAMRRFHEETAADFQSVCIPTPDGLLMAIKPLG